MSTKQIHRVSVFQSSKILAFMLFIMTAIVAIPAGIFLMLSGEDGGGLLLIAPFLYFVGFFIFYAVFFWFYNLVAGRVGGIEISLKDED